MGNVPFDETALRITPSPPPSQGSASSAVESKYIKRIQFLNYARLALSGLLVVLGVTIIACEGHALHSYDTSHLKTQWWLPLWPQHFDLRPSITLLASAAIVVVASLTYIIIALIPSPHSRTTTLSILFTTTTFITCLSTLLSLGYWVHLRHQNSLLGRSSLQTWTCRWASGVSATDIASASGASSSSATVFGTNGGITAPGGFHRICSESSAAWGITVAVICLDGLCGGLVVAWGWWVAFRVWRERRRESKVRGLQEEWVMQNRPGTVGGAEDVVGGYGNGQQV